jgi:hypothetical protein
MNKKTHTIIAALTMSFVSSCAYAEPSPFGITINKTTEEELKSKYRFTDEGENQYSRGRMYKIHPAQVEFEGLESLTVIFSKDNKALAVIANIGKNKYDKVLANLSSKYKLISKKDAFVGDKAATLVDDDTNIYLSAPHMSFSMRMSYIHKDLDTLYDKQSAEEEKQKNEKEAGNL